MKKKRESLLSEALALARSPHAVSRASEEHVREAIALQRRQQFLICLAVVGVVCILALAVAIVFVS